MTFETAGVEWTLVKFNGEYGYLPTHCVWSTGYIRPDGSVWDYWGEFFRDMVDYPVSSYTKGIKERGGSTNGQEFARDSMSLAMWPPEIHLLPEASDDETRAFKEASKAKEDRSDVTESERAPLVQGLLNAGVSRLEADQVAALYLQHRHVSSAPPLPPRSTADSSSLTTDSPPINVDSTCHILILSDTNTASAMVAQCYFELLRAYTAKAGRPWLFRDVTRIASTNVEAAREMNSSLTSYHHFAALETMLTLFAASTHDGQLPYLANDIIQRVRIGGRETVDFPLRVYEESEEKIVRFNRYDYVLTFDPAIFRYWTRMLQEDRYWPSVTAFGKVPPRVVLLPEVTMQRDGEPQNGKDTTYSISPLQAAIEAFLKQHVNWTDPRTPRRTYPLDVTFVQCQGSRRVERVNGTGGVVVMKRIEERTQCKIHVTAQADGKMWGWVVAIVGPKEKVRMARALVERLRDEGRVDL